MHARTSDKAKAVLDALAALPESGLMELIDLCEIQAALTLRKDANHPRTIEEAQACADTKDVKRSWKGATIPFVKDGCSFTYIPPLNLYSYAKVPEWKRLKALLKQVEKTSKESLVAQRNNLDITHMMQPPTCSQRKAFVTINHDGALKKRGTHDYQYHRAHVGESTNGNDSHTED